MPGKQSAGRGWPWGGGRGGGRGGSAKPNRNKGVTPRKRCEREGLDIRNVERVSSASDIDGRDHTLYVVSDTIAGFSLLNVRDVAVVGAVDAQLRVPADDRGWDVLVRGGSGFLFAGIDIDQTAPGAWGRVQIDVDDKGIVADVMKQGRGRKRNPDVSSPPDNPESGAWYLPAAEEGVNKMVNVTDVHGGYYLDKHWAGNAKGMWYGPAHRGTLRVIDCRIEEFGGNGIYAANVPGRIEVEGGRLWNNGVSQARISHGHYHDVTAGYDCENTGMLNADAPEHGVVGLCVNQKKQGATRKPGVDVKNCSIHMINVAKGGTALRAYDVRQPSNWGAIEDTDIHIEAGAPQWAADIEIPGEVEAIRNVEFSGSLDNGVGIRNSSGRRVVCDGCVWNYPSGRRRDNGNVRWR